MEILSLICFQALYSNESIVFFQEAKFCKLVLRNVVLRNAMFGIVLQAYTEGITSYSEPKFCEILMFVCLQKYF